jgi:hypothetical protein
MEYKNFETSETFEPITGKRQISTATLNPPTLPTGRPTTPTFDDYAPSKAHGDVRLTPPTTASQPQPFSPLDMHPTNRISHHHRHLTGRSLHYLLHLPSNTQGLTRRLLPHVSLKTPFGQTPHLPDHWKLTTQRRETQKNTTRET